MAEDEKKNKMKFVLNDDLTGMVSHMESKTILNFDLKTDLPEIASIWSTLSDYTKFVVIWGVRIILRNGAAMEKGTSGDNKMAGVFKIHKKIFVDHLLHGVKQPSDKVAVNKLREAAEAAGISMELFEAMMAKVQSK